MGALFQNSLQTQVVDVASTLLKAVLMELLTGLRPSSGISRRSITVGNCKMHVQTLAVTLATYLILNSVGSVSAQTVSPELDACRSTGLIALKEHNPSIKDVTFDVDGMTVAKANTKVEDTVIKTIVIGDAYLEKGKKDTRRTFLCLIGEKGKVLLTFFTDK